MFGKEVKGCSRVFLVWQFIVRSFSDFLRRPICFVDLKQLYTYLLVKSNEGFRELLSVFTGLVSSTISWLSFSFSILDCEEKESKDSDRKWSKKPMDTIKEGCRNKKKSRHWQCAIWMKSRPENFIFWSESIGLRKKNAARAEDGIIVWANG